MTTAMLIRMLQKMPPEQDVCFYIPDLERPHDANVYNWREIESIKAVKCEHDDYVMVTLGREA